MYVCLYLPHLLVFLTAVLPLISFKEITNQLLGFAPSFLIDTITDAWTINIALDQSHLF